MNKKTIAKLVIAGSIGFTTLAAPTVAFAAPESEEEFDARLNELNAEQSEAEDKLSSLEEEISSTEAEADELVEEMEKTAALLNRLQTEIEELNTIIEQRAERLASQARAVQVTGESGSVLRFLLEADSLSDVIGRIDVVSTLVSANQNLMQQQMEDKELVVEKEEETLAKQEEQMLIAAELENKKVELEEQSAEQESLVAAIAAERAEVAEEREHFLAEQRAAEQRRQEIEAARVAASQVSVASASEEASDSEGTVSTSSSAEASESGESQEPAKRQQQSAPAPNPSGGSVVSIAHSLTGSPYSYGGTSPSGFDCSGFITYVFNQAGARGLPRTAAGMYSATTRVSRSEAQPGDLVFFSQGGGIDHAGIYLGGGNFIGAQTSTGVAVATINSGYWSNYVVGFGR